MHAYLCARPRFSGGTFDFHNPFVHLRGLLFEQLDQESGVGSRENYLGAFLRHIDTKDIRPYTVSLTVALPWNLLLFGQNRISATQIDNDVTPFDSLDDPREDFAFTILKFIIDQLALCFAHLLDDALFCHLGCNASKRSRRELAEQLVANLSLRVECLLRVSHSYFGFRVCHAPDNSFNFKEFNLTYFLIKLRFDLLLPKGPTGRRQHGTLKRLNNDVPVHPFFSTDLFDHTIQV